MAWTNEQLDAINKDGTNIIVSAGAGSGKTAVLTERVIRKLKQGVDVDRLLVLTFTNAVDYGVEEIVFQELISIPGDEPVPVVRNLSKATLDPTKQQLQIELENTLENGKTYRITVGNVAKEIVARIGAPNRIEITYGCLGKENTAYAYDETINLDVPVKLSYRLKYGTIDVTETYDNLGGYLCTSDTIWRFL